MRLASTAESLSLVGLTENVRRELRDYCSDESFDTTDRKNLARELDRNDPGRTSIFFRVLREKDEQLRRTEHRQVSSPDTVVNRAGHGADTARDAVVATIICMADVQPERVTWLWRHRIPRKKLSIIEGQPGIGKSHLDLEITARVTRAEKLPEGDVPDEPEIVMLMSAEDGVGDTIQPRLVAAGADLRRVFFAKCVAMNGNEPRGWILPQDIPALRDEIVKVGATVLIIDPLSAYLGDDTKSHNEHSVRRAITPLAELADDLGITVIVVRHLVKSPAGDAISAGGGSIGFIGVARACLVAARDPEDEKQVILASVKNNLCLTPRSLKYRIVGAADERSRIDWLGSSDLNANQLIAAGRDTEERDAVQEAKDFLTSALASKPVPKTELVRSAQAEKTSQRTLERAAKELGVLREREGFGGPVMWSLPNTHTTGEYGSASAPKSLRENARTFTPSSLARMDDEPYSPAPDSDEERELVSQISRTDAAEKRAAELRHAQGRS
jgi:hypothetical protein